jgi:hypothetical protein
MTKHAIPGVIIAFLIFYVITSPDQAASIFHSAWQSVVNVAHGLGTFVDKLTA